MWQRWFLNQCVAVGWHVKWNAGFTLNGPTNQTDWDRARKCLQKISIGDKVIVALQGNRVGRIGEVTRLAVDDEDWNPLVPISTQWPEGEMGRRIMLRWDLTCGPDDRDQIVQLPPNTMFNRYEVRQTICEVKSHSAEDFMTSLKDQTNWIGLHTKFKYESALQAYISTFPHHLEDGLMVHPDLKVREKVFTYRTRLDVLLIDRNENAVVVECKRDGPSLAAINQIRGYLTHLERETKRKPRGILVHGGSRNLTTEVREAAMAEPQVQIIQYNLKVGFDLCH